MAGREIDGRGMAAAMLEKVASDVEALKKSDMPVIDSYRLCAIEKDTKTDCSVY